MHPVSAGACPKKADGSGDSSCSWIRNRRIEISDLVIELSNVDETVQTQSVVEGKLRRHPPGVLRVEAVCLRLRLGMLTRTHVRIVNPPCQKAGEAESCPCITGQSGFEVAEAEMPRTVDTISRSHRVNQIRCSELQIVSGYGPAKIRIDRQYG